METSLTFGEALQKRANTKKINGVRKSHALDVNAATDMLRLLFDGCDMQTSSGTQENEECTS